MEQVDMKDVLKEIIEALAEGPELKEIEVGKLTPDELEIIKNGYDSMKAKEDDIKRRFIEKKEQLMAGVKAELKVFVDEMEAAERPAMEKEAANLKHNVREIIEFHGFDPDETEIRKHDGALLQYKGTAEVE